MKNFIVLPTLLLFFVFGFWACARDTNDRTIVEGPTVDAVPVHTVAEVSAAAPGITTVAYSEESFNFGEVPVGDTARHTYYIRNTGTEPLEFTQTPKPSCGCTFTDYSREAVAPGEQLFVTVVYPAKKSGMFRKSVTVHTNTDPAVKVLRFEGEATN